MVAELVEVLRAVSFFIIMQSQNLHFPSKNLHLVAKNDTPLWYFCTEMLINTHPQTFEIWFGMSIFV